MVSSTESPSPFTFRLHTRLRDSPVPQQRIRDNGGQLQARTGTITTPHGPIRTPAFIPVATQAAVKAVLPESMAAEGAQAMLAMRTTCSSSRATTSWTPPAGWAPS